MNHPQPDPKDHKDSISKLKIGIIHAGLSHMGEQEAAHSRLVRSLVDGAQKELKRIGLKENQITVIECPGSLEIPQMAHRAISELDLNGVQACSLIVDGGIYRHEFVAQTSLDKLMQVSLDTGIPVASTLLTPARQNSPVTQFDELHTHLYDKGREGASALIWQILQLGAVSQN